MNFRNQERLFYSLANFIPRLHLEGLTYLLKMVPKVATLVNQKQAAGVYQVEWDGMNSTSGVYLYKIEAGEYREVRKMVLLR